MSKVIENVAIISRIPPPKPPHKIKIYEYDRKYTEDEINDEYVDVPVVEYSCENIVDRPPPQPPPEIYKENKYMLQIKKIKENYDEDETDSNDYSQSSLPTPTDDFILPPPTSDFASPTEENVFPLNEIQHKTLEILRNMAPKDVFITIN